MRAGDCYRIDATGVVRWWVFSRAAIPRPNDTVGCGAAARLVYARTAARSRTAPTGDRVVDVAYGRPRSARPSTSRANSPVTPAAAVYGR